MLDHIFVINVKMKLKVMLHLGTYMYAYLQVRSWHEFATHRQ